MMTLLAKLPFEFSLAVFEIHKSMHDQSYLSKYYLKSNHLSVLYVHRVVEWADNDKVLILFWDFSDEENHQTLVGNAKLPLE